MTEKISILFAFVIAACRPAFAAHSLGATHVVFAHATGPKRDGRRPFFDDKKYPCHAAPDAGPGAADCPQVSN